MGTGIGVGIAGEVYDLKPGTATPPPSCTTEYSLEFDGLTEYGRKPISPILGVNGEESFTISVWVKTPALGDYWLLDTSASTPPVPPEGIWGWRILPNGATSFRTAGGTGTAGNIDVIGPAMVANKWHLVSIVVDTVANAGIGYLDVTPGVVANLGGRDWVSVKNDNFLLGRTGVGKYFRGFMCHLAIWNKALTASELGELYSNNTGKCYASDFAFSGFLQNYYPMFNSPSSPGVYTTPLPDTVSGLDIDLINMSLTNVSTDHPPQL